MRTKVAVIFTALVLAKFYIEIQASSNLLLGVEEKDIISDLPSQKDLQKYIHTLTKILNYVYTDLNNFNIALFVGLNLMKVNLKHAFHETEEPLDDETKGYIKGLIQDTEMITSNYLNQQIDSAQKYTELKIASLFSVDSLFLIKMKKYNGRLPISKEYPHVIAEEEWPVWSEYQEQLNEVDNHLPSPRLSDMCLYSLAENYIRYSEGREECLVYQPCYDVLVNGTNFGYSLSHRVLLIIAAQYGRGCSILSNAEDEMLLKKLCEQCYHEAEYISQHRFQMFDLLMEFSAVCSLEGNAQFLRRSWLKTVLQFQKSTGCFLKPLANLEDLGDNPICCRHTTAVAAATYGAAVRFILETYNH